MNHEYEDNFDEFNEATLADAAKRFENMLQRKEQPYFNEEVFESLAEYYLVEGKFELAWKACKFGLKNYPHSLDLMLTKTQLLISRFELEEANELLDQASIFHPSDTEIDYFRGVILIYSGENEKALELFQNILLIAEEKENIYFQMGMAYLNLGLFSDAIEVLKTAIEHRSSNELAYNELVYAYELLLRFEDGVEFFNHKIDQDPYDYLAWNALGLCFNGNDDFEKAEHAFDYAITINDKFASGWYNLGQCFMNQDKFDEAIGAFKKTLEFEEKTAEVLTVLGMAHEKLEQYSEAYKNYKLATETDENWDEAWFGMSSVLYEQEKYIESIHFVKKALKLNDINADYCLLLADCESKLGNLVSAEEAYAHASELDATNPDIWLNWSLMYFEADEYAKAYEIVEDGLIDLPEDADLYYRAVVYLLFMSDFNHAYKYLQTALTLDYDKHTQIYEYFSNLETLKALQRIIEQFR